jgi:trehalose 6-phosphate phosphatase
MRPILSADARGALDVLAAGHGLLAFDFDGTLAPIVDDRDAARIPTSTRRLLGALSLLYPCAVVSGRARADVAARLRGLHLVAIVGNHGSEAALQPLDPSRRARVLGWMRALKRELSLVPGVDVEDKWHSLAVHYRHVPARAAARALVLRAAATLDGARAFGGHEVVNVVPRDAPDKGTAVEALVRSFGPRPALYVGDDRTDEDAFRSPSVEVTVRVGRTARSAARWYLPAQGAIDGLLRALLEARTRHDKLGDVRQELAGAA